MSAAGGASVVGVVGAGTMGAGIAQLAAQAGARTLLHDPAPEALEAGTATIAAALRRAAEKGRMTPEDAAAATARVEAAPTLEDLAPCELVVEAAPESLPLKGELFTRLAAITGAVLATNTSSIPVTAVAAASGVPERVCGMHFFNPAHAMALVEVIAGIDTAPEAVALVRATAEAMGKRVVDAADGPGFLVNRCNRPFSLEALRLVQEGLAAPEQIDRACRLGGGFRMGPFELMDLVGIDVGFAVSESFHALSFGEPRWRPSPLAARMVAAGRLGRKSGRGWYAYTDGEPHRSPDPPAPAVGDGGGDLVVIAGDTPIAHDLRELAAAAGFDARTPEDAEGEVAVLHVDCGADPDGPPLRGAPLAVLLAEGALVALEPGGDAAGFHALPPLAPGGVAELTGDPSTPAHDRAARFFAALGLHVEHVGDAPGGLLGRIVCQLVNEAAFAVSEGVGSAQDVDAGMVLGLNHPRGPLAWADLIGVEHVLAVLDALFDEYREERYRAAPLLRRLVLEDRRFHEG